MKEQFNFPLSLSLIQKAQLQCLQKDYCDCIQDIYYQNFAIHVVYRDGKYFDGQFEYSTLIAPFHRIYSMIALGAELHMMNSGMSAESRAEIRDYLLNEIKDRATSENRVFEHPLELSLIKQAQLQGIHKEFSEDISDLFFKDAAVNLKLRNGRNFKFSTTLATFNTICDVIVNMMSGITFCKSLSSSERSEFKVFLETELERGY